MPGTTSPPVAIADRGVIAKDGTTKARIERAAVTLFVARGVDAATTREIAAASNVAEGTLYRHFASKDDIAESVFFAIHERLADLVNGTAQSAREAGGAFGEVVDAVVDALCGFADEDPTVFTYHLLNTHEYLPRRDDAHNPVAAIECLITEAAQRGEMLTSDPRLIGAMALGPVLQTALHRVYGRLEGSMSSYAPALKTAVRRVLALPPAGAECR